MTSEDDGYLVFLSSKISKIVAARCDMALNPKNYWSLGVSTVFNPEKYFWIAVFENIWTMICDFEDFFSDSFLKL